MRIAILIPCLIFIASAMASAAGELPVLQPGIILNDGDTPMSVGHTASVEVVDWNNDGKKDLLVGTFAGGSVLLFLNQGTDTAPSFEGGTKLYAGDNPLSAGAG